MIVSRFAPIYLQKTHTMSATATTVAIASATVPSAYALTTTFTAPTQCAQSIGGLTMLENDVFRIWLNAPLPVPGTTISSCYPDQFMSSFLLQAGGVTQAPFEPLVCPEGYSTIGPFTSNYIACCPSGWDGFAPASDPPSGKPNSLTIERHERSFGAWELRGS